MKLRNKKTGEIAERSSIVTLRYKISSSSSSLVEAEEFGSIEQLNEEWEDYNPTEPLIKDPKVRKAVRAWAEAQELTELYLASNGYEIYGGIDDWVMQFKGEPFPFADKNKTYYTIAELCGEEG